MNVCLFLFLVNSDHLELVTLIFEEAHLMVINSRREETNMIYVLVAISSWQALLGKWCNTCDGWKDFSTCGEV